MYLTSNIAKITLATLLIIISSKALSQHAQRDLKYHETAKSILENFSSIDIKNELNNRAKGLKRREWDTSNLVKYKTGDLLYAFKESQAIAYDIKVIYGKDDRREVANIKDISILKNTKTVVAFIKKSSLYTNGNGSVSCINYKSYRKTFGLCKSESYGKQPSISYCSGFALSSNIIATAGHCIKQTGGHFKIDDFAMVFGYQMNVLGVPITTFSPDDIYYPTEVLEWEDERTTHNNPRGKDYALLRVDKKIPKTRIVRIDSNINLKQKDALYSIGHPKGLPMKYAGSAYVRDNNNSIFFVANLDTYSGNSGSPVFDSKNNTVAGMLIRGDVDFQNRRRCKVSKVCPTTSCRGEDVLRVSQFISQLKTHLNNNTNTNTN